MIAPSESDLIVVAGNQYHRNGPPCEALEDSIEAIHSQRPTVVPKVTQKQNTSFSFDGELVDTIQHL